VRRADSAGFDSLGLSTTHPQTAETGALLKIGGDTYRPPRVAAITLQVPILALPIHFFRHFAVGCIV